MIRTAEYMTQYKVLILVNNKLDALFSMYLFHFSTCFEQPSAHHQCVKLVINKNYTDMHGQQNIKICVAI